MSESGGLRAGPGTRAQKPGKARREEGQTLLEYALILTFIAMGAVVAVIALGPAIGESFQTVTAVF